MDPWYGNRFYSLSSNEAGQKAALNPKLPGRTHPMQTGLGFFIYKLTEIIKHVTPDMLVDLLKQVGAKWISIKISDGESKYNQIGGNDKVLLSYIDKLEAAKIMVGGWSYCYPSPTHKPNLEAAVIGERIQKLRLQFVDLDIEAEWKKANLYV
jgi:hypothetical protein